MPKDNLAVIIATKDRPQELSRLLGSITMQQIRPSQIIIVDGGNCNLSDVLSSHSELNIDYLKLVPPSLTRQRNAGIKTIRKNISITAFFDDDITLENNSLVHMMKFWENASLDTAGACFNNMSEPFKKPGLGEKMFLVNADIPGRILRSGFQSIPCAVATTMQVDWLIGCAMIYRKSIFGEFSFDEWFDGYARYEDVDFSYRVGKKYKMFVVADAKIKHYVKLERLEDSFALGKMEIINRLYFVKKNPDLSPILCGWALLGILLNNLLKALFGRSPRYILRAKGGILGFIELLSKKRFK